MAENSKIEWTDHTFNPWIGCTKVGPGCDNCYAADLSKARLGVPWGPGEPRRHTAASTWKQPRTWNKKAAKLGIRYRVFCASLADVFDNEVPAEWRAELFQLIRETPHLDWLLVTKRIGNAAKMAEAAGGWPENVWLGATIVNQAEADRDIPKLLQTDGPRYRFLSMEPLLGPVDIGAYLDGCYECSMTCGVRLSSTPDLERCERCGEECGPETEPVISDGCPKCGGELEFVCPECASYMVYQHPDTRVLDWVIVGGESGPKARPMHPDWARSLRDQCAVAGVPFLFKQWGEWVNERQSPVDAIFPGEGRDPFGQGEYWAKLGKKRAGRLLDGAEHNGFPGTQS